MTLEDLLRKGSMDFRMAVQETYPDRGVRVIVHPLCESGDTLDFVVLENTCATLEQGEYLRNKGKK